MEVASNYMFRPLW